MGVSLNLPVCPGSVVPAPCSPFHPLHLAPLGEWNPAEGAEGGLDCQSRLFLGSLLEGQRHLLGNRHQDRKGEEERGAEEGGRTDSKAGRWTARWGRGVRLGGAGGSGRPGTRRGPQLEAPERPGGRVTLGPRCGSAQGTRSR